MRIAGAVVLLALTASELHADCAETRADWVVSQGDLAPGRTCGSWISSTNAATTGYSFSRVASAQTVTVPYRVTVTWRRLGSDARALELHVLGAAVLIGTDRLGVWTDEASFAIDGFHPLPGHSTRDEHEVSVLQTSDTIVVSVDGAEVDRWAIATNVQTGPIALAFKGGLGARAQMWFRDFRLEPLDAAQGQPSPRPK